LRSKGSESITQQLDAADSLQLRLIMGLAIKGIIELNQQLKNELQLMQQEDQRVLQELIDSGELGTNNYHPGMKAVHEKNNARIKEIINQYGWPGFSLVGKEGSKAAWLIVQHAVLDTDFMDKCLPLLKDAINQGEAEGWCLAYLQDRILTMSGKPQIYGTLGPGSDQGKCLE